MDDHLKKPFFIGFFAIFPFLFFFFFLFLFSNIKKKKNKKCNFLFENLIFDNPKFCKNTILTHCDTICVTKKAKKHYKLGKNSKKNLDQFLTYNLDQFLTYKTPNLGPVFNFTAHIYIYMLWCYYLGQVWPFEVLLSGPSLLFTKYCLSKNTIKIGVSALFFCKKKLRAQI